MGGRGFSHGVNLVSLWHGGLIVMVEMTFPIVEWSYHVASRLRVKYYIVIIFHVMNC